LKVIQILTVFAVSMCFGVIDIPLQLKLFKIVQYTALILFEETQGNMKLCNLNCAF
jgi:hypothetical protein